MKEKFYLVPEEDLINLLKNMKNMSICLNNNLINKEDFGLAFIKWIAEERKLKGELNNLTIEKEYDEWTRDYIEQYFVPLFLKIKEEEEIDPMILN